MPNPKTANVINEEEVFQFGEFALDVRGRELRRAGIVLPLKGNPFDVLVYLLKNHERVVPGTEIFDAIWNEGTRGGRLYDPQSVQQAVSTIRGFLGDSPRNPNYVATFRGRGIRFIGTITDPNLAADPPLKQPEVTLSRKRRSVLKSFLLMVSTIVPLILAVIVLASPSVQAPQVIDSVSLTHDSTVKYAPVRADGVRAYFTEVVGGRYAMSTVNLRSLETTLIPSSIPDPYLCDFSADSRLLLVRSVVGGFDDYGPLFIQSIDGGPAQPLPVSAFDAIWAPDAKSIVFARGTEVGRFDLATRQTSQLALIKGFAWWPRFSPDRRRLRFTVTDDKTQATSIWEVPAAGGEAHRLFDPKVPWGAAGSGNWTADGKYFVFQVGPRAASNIWLVNESNGFLPWRNKPIQLTFGRSYRGPQPSSDGSTIFARTQLPRGEMFKFDQGGSATSVLPGVLTDMVSFAPDGLSMVYCLADREKALWYSRSDGSGARRLTTPSTEAAFPHWSPDGRLVAVATRIPGKAPWKISVIPVDSTAPRRELKSIDRNALHPSWSRDGRKIMFGTIPTLGGEAHLYTIDLASEQVSIIPGSENLFAPAWSPDGRYIAALAADSYRLVILDNKNGARYIVTESRVGIPVWSRDGKSIYSVRRCQRGTCVFSVDPTSRKLHQMFDIGQFPLLDRWMGIHPDGSLLLAKDVSVQEIEALKLEPKLSEGR